MPDKLYDVLVIGGGPGGYTAAIRAAQLKFRTAIVERERLGGVCLNWGCIPTKALLRNAEVLNLFKKAADWGISAGNLQIDFRAMITRSRNVSDRVSRGVEYLMKKNSIDSIAGTARLAAPGEVEIRAEGNRVQTIGARSVILATGARPRTISGVAIDRKRIISSTEAMTLSVQPKSLIIIGAGAIGIEFAYFYASLGTEVTVVEMMPGILPQEDREIARQLELALKKQGITFLTGARVEGAQPDADGVRVSVALDGETRELSADYALMAVGVQGNVENLGLEQVGVTHEADRIMVDAHYRTNVAGIYAIGDVIGPPWLAHVASAEGVHCVESIAGLDPQPVDYRTIPACTYCQPQVASVGLTEEKAKAEGHEILVGKCPFRPMGKAVAIGESEGMVKLIFDARYGELLGAHILGSEATELIAELVIARRLGTTGKDLFRAVYAHPTLSEAVMEAAAAAYGEAINI